MMNKTRMPKMNFDYTALDKPYEPLLIKPAKSVWRKKFEKLRTLYGEEPQTVSGSVFNDLKQMTDYWTSSQSKPKKAPINYLKRPTFSNSDRILSTESKKILDDVSHYMHKAEVSKDQDAEKEAFETESLFSDDSFCFERSLSEKRVGNTNKANPPNGPTQYEMALEKTFFDCLNPEKRKAEKNYFSAEDWTKRMISNSTQRGKKAVTYQADSRDQIRYARSSFYPKKREESQRPWKTTETSVQNTNEPYMLHIKLKEPCKGLPKQKKYVTKKQATKIWKY